MFQKNPPPCKITTPLKGKLRAALTAVVNYGTHCLPSKRYRVEALCYLTDIGLVYD